MPDYSGTTLLQSVQGHCPAAAQGTVLALLRRLGARD